MQFLWIFALICGSQTGEFAEKIQLPIIKTLSSSVFVEINKNITILCEDKEPTEWWMLESEISRKEDFVKPLITKSFYTTANKTENPFKNELTLRNVQRKHMKMYLCIKKSMRSYALNSHNYTDCSVKDEAGNCGFEMVYEIGDYDWRKVSSVFVYVKDPREQMPPKINFVNTTAALEKFTDFNISCESDKPIFWKSDHHSAFESQKYQTNNRSRPYGLTLILKNVTCATVASYYCIKEIKTHFEKESIFEYPNLQYLLNENIAAKIHVFVNDQACQIAPIMPKAHYLYKHRDSLIPCRPTMPEQLVALFTPDGNEFCVDMGSFECKSKIKKIGFDSIDYDATLGFILRNVDCEGNIFPQSIKFLCNSTNQFTTIKSGCISLAFGQPRIISDTNHVAMVGETFQLKCSCQKMSPVWIYPANIEESRLKITEIRGRYPPSTILTITNAKKSDAGIFSCVSVYYDGSDYFEHYEMKIFDSNDQIFYLNEVNHQRFFKADIGKDIEITIKYHINPTPDFIWFRNNGQLLQNSTKYQIHKNETTLKFKITNFQMADSDLYTLEATSGTAQKSLQFDIRANHAPAVRIEAYYKKSEHEARVNAKCFVISDVTPDELHCKFWPTCEFELYNMACDEAEEQNLNAKYDAQGYNETERIYSLDFSFNFPGLIKCEAANFDGTTIGTAEYFISENLTIFGYETEQKIQQDEVIEMACVVLKELGFEKVNWYKNNLLLESEATKKVNYIEGKYTLGAILKIIGFSEINAGEYECRAGNDNDTFLSKSVNLKGDVTPQWRGLHKTLEIIPTRDYPLELECKRNNVTPANAYFTWYKNDKELEPSKFVNFQARNSKLLLTSVRKEDEGVYRCEIINVVDNKKFSITIGKIITYRSYRLVCMIVIIVATVFFVAALTIWTTRACTQKSKRKKSTEEEARLRAAFKRQQIDNTLNSLKKPST